MDRDSVVTPERLRLFLLGAAMGVLLHQRGLLVLHASAVEIGGGAVAFLAPKWRGKSTLAAILHWRGYPLITDDVLAIDMSGSTPLVQSAFPQLKLWPDTLELLGERDSDAPRLHPDFEKRDYRVESKFTCRATPLRALYVIGAADEPYAERVDSLAALNELIGHWYCARFGYETLARLGLTSHFLWTAELVSRVPVYRLGRPRSLSVMREVATVVEESLGRIDTTPSNHHE